MKVYTIDVVFFEDITFTVDVSIAPAEPDVGIMNEYVEEWEIIRVDAIPALRLAHVTAGPVTPLSAADTIMGRRTFCTSWLFWAPSLRRAHRGASWRQLMNSSPDTRR